MAIVDPAQQKILADRLAAQQAAAIATVPPVKAPPIVTQPGVVPLDPALTGVTPLTMPTTIQNPAEGLAGTDTILGMTPEQFQAVMGGIGQALAPPDTWQSRLGAFAKQLGQGQIVGGLTGQDITGSELKPKTPAKAAKKSKLGEAPALPTKVDLSETLLGE